MNKSVKLAIKKTSAFILAFTMMLMTLSTTVFATDNSTLSEVFSSESSSDIIVTYNMETHETTYNSYQNLPNYDLEIENANVPSTYSNEIWNIQDSPYRNICCITTIFPDGYSIVGSGTLVYFDILLTAGHCVYKSEHGGWASTIKVVPGEFKNQEPLGFTTSTLITCPNEYLNDTNPQYDWAVVDLQHSFDTWQLYGYYGNYSTVLNYEVTGLGYPDNSGSVMYEDKGNITYIDDKEIVCSFAAKPGESGGALIDDKTGYLVGILVRAGNNYTVAIHMNQRIANVIMSRRD